MSAPTLEFFRMDSKSTNFFAFNPNGSLKWTFSTTNFGQIVATSPAVGANGTICFATLARPNTDYVGDLDGSGPGTVYAITDHTNHATLSWTYTDIGPTAQYFSSPAVTSNNIVYIGSRDGSLSAISNGTLLWVGLTGGAIISSPAIGSDGTVYVGSEDGKVYAFPGTNGMATNAHWPMFHQNVRHTVSQ